MDISKYKLWTESDWADQLVREENNIKAYFEELEKYLDLPDEDYLIYAALKKRKLETEELEYKADITEYSFENEDLHEVSDYNLKNQGTNCSFYFHMGEISADLCRDIGFSGIEVSDDMLLLLFVSGRLMSLYMDYLQLEAEELPELKKAILKRNIALLNTFFGMLNKYNSMLGSKKTEDYRNRIYKARELLIELRFAI